MIQALGLITVANTQQLLQAKKQDPDPLFDKIIKVMLKTFQKKPNHPDYRAQELLVLMDELKDEQKMALADVLIVQASEPLSGSCFSSGLANFYTRIQVIYEQVLQGQNSKMNEQQAHQLYLSACEKISKCKNETDDPILKYLIEYGHRARSYKDKLNNLKDLFDLLKHTQSIEDVSKRLAEVDRIISPASRDWFTNLFLVCYWEEKDPNWFLSLHNIGQTSQSVLKINITELFLLIGLIYRCQGILERPLQKETLPIHNLLTTIYQDNENKDKTGIFKCKNPNASCLLSIIKSVRETMESASSFPCTLFTKARRKVAPWFESLCNFKNSLENDPQFLQEYPYYIALTAKEGQKSTSLQAIIENFLHTDKEKVLLVEGYLGSGKSFSMQMIASELYKKYKSDCYFPIVISLASYATDNKTTTILEEIIQKENLGDLHKHRKVVWILDACDEMVDKNNLLFNSKDLMENPNFKVIVTRRIAETSNYKCLWSQEALGDSFRQCTLEPFNSESIFNYISQYLEVCEKRKKAADPKEKPWYETLWNIQQYKTYINSHAQILELISNPLFLKIMTDTLPYIEQFQKENSSNNQQLIEDVDLLDAFFCCLIEREISKQSQDSLNGVSLNSIPTFIREKFSIQTPLKTAYLNYAIQLAKDMKTYLEQNKLSSRSFWISLDDTATSQHFGIYFLDQLANSDPKAANVIATLRRGIPLIKRDKSWGFINERFFEYFNSLSSDLTHKRLIERRLKTSAYHFGQKDYKESIKEIVDEKISNN